MTTGAGPVSVASGCVMVEMVGKECNGGNTRKEAAGRIGDRLASPKRCQRRT